MQYILALATLVMLAGCFSAGKNMKANTGTAINPVVAHRGAFKKNGFPENSIASLREAIRLGCAGSEFDVRMTADDSLVINHDPDYHKLPIEKTNYADLQQYQLSNGEKLPTLQEYILAGLENNPGTLLVCEIKPSAISKERGKQVAEMVVNLFRQLHAGGKVVYISFDYDILLKIKELHPAAITQYLDGNKTPAQLKADGISGLDYHFSVFKNHPEWITEARSLGLALNAWTVNDATTMDWLLEQRFDYITTNEPELLGEKIKAKTK